MEEEERVRAGVEPSVYHIRILLEESMVRSFISNIVFFFAGNVTVLMPYFFGGIPVGGISAKHSFHWKETKDRHTHRSRI